MSRLFTPLQIGSMTIRNRTFMAPMSLGYDDQSGCPNAAQQEYWLTRARGGVGCIITDVLSVDPYVPYLGNTLCFRSEESIARYKEFTDKIHETGAKIIPQLSHPGPESISSFFGVTPIASSDYYNSMGQKVRALELDEIPSIIEKYASTAYQVKLAGFDGIELHSAHAYMLLGSFLSPLRNKRSDAYGGCLDNRARLLFEVIDAIKAKCGAEFPIILRISGSERDSAGNTVEDIKYLVPKLIEHGVDAFEISGGTQYERPNKIIPCHGEQEGVNIPEAQQIKAVSTVPVLVVGKNNNPQKAMNYVDAGVVDGVVFGRALLADPEFINKSIQGRFDEIAPCACCVVGCVQEQTARRPGSCVINPFAGKELTMKIEATDHPKRVAVIGGGMAGMACARMLALRGHKPVIYEKQNVLGGQMNLACIPPHKQELSKWLIYLNAELKRLNVEVHLNTVINETTIKDLACDVIVIATGSRPIIPAIEGVSSPITAHDILKGKVTIPEGKVLIVGGGMVGMETCEYLYEQKQGVLELTLIEMTKSIGGNMAVNNLLPALNRLKAAHVKMMTNTKLVRINGSDVVVSINENEKITLSGFTHIIFACGSKGEQSLYETTKNMDKPSYLIGDALNARQALEAVREGVQAALEI